VPRKDPDFVHVVQIGQTSLALEFDFLAICSLERETKRTFMDVAREIADTKRMGLDLCFELVRAGLNCGAGDERWSKASVAKLYKDATREQREALVNAAVLSFGATFVQEFGTTTAPQGKGEAPSGAPSGPTGPASSVPPPA
jgi:hypothetical protein